MSINDTKKWFEQALPEPTAKHACIQIGCAFEETGELARTLYDFPLHCQLTFVADAYKRVDPCSASMIERLDDDEKVQMLDDIVDEIVTRIGIAHCMGFDIAGALKEVNRSNFSKFEGGKPVFDCNGKITKGKNYTPPNLKPFV